jgi:hypothetical protein
MRMRTRTLAAAVAAGRRRAGAQTGQRGPRRRRARRGPRSVARAASVAAQHDARTSPASSRSARTYLGEPRAGAGTGGAAGRRWPTCACA